MSPKQYERWLRLSVGLARSGFQGITRKRRARLVFEVRNAIDWIVCNGLEWFEDWDSDKGDGSVSSRLDNWLYDNGHKSEHYRTDREKGNTFSNQIACCVRAGLDVAVAPSAGVIAFDVGDLQRACRGRIPDWVRNFFHPPLPVDAAKEEELWL
jgi:hypothetical protein